MAHTSLAPVSAAVFAAALAAALTSASCKQRTFHDSALTKSSSEGDTATWEKERAERQASLDRYLGESMKDRFVWFRDFPVGNQGLPALLFRILPTLSLPLTEIWGEPETKMAKLGLGPHPEFPDYPFPLGIGWTRAPGLVPVNVGVFTCGACHIGRVVGPGNRVIHLYGAPNTQFDAHGFTSAVIETARAESFTADNIRKAIETNNQNPFWLYGRSRPMHVVAEKFDVAVLSKTAEQTVAKIKANAEDRQGKIERVLQNGPYREGSGAGGSIKGGNPGRLDAFSTAIALLSHLSDASPTEIVLQKPAMSDIMSVWGQRKRAIAQWDGSVRAELVRNLGAELGVVGDPERVDVKNAVLTTELLRDLPPPPYPFKVDSTLAAQGKGLYQAHCAGCHRDRSETIYPAEVIGTDPNRAQLFTPKGRELLIAGLRKACPQSIPECRELKDEDMVKPSDAKRGYVALPLEGIWARAPYLHNGSVPTLMHLLVPELRERDDAKIFWRGNIGYDQTFVGFEWRTNKAPPGFAERAYIDAGGAFLAAHRYDTTLVGSSNKGHDTILRNDGRRWSADESTPEGKETRALLEYLKTL